MDERANRISPNDPYRRLGAVLALAAIDIRRQGTVSTDDKLLTCRSRSREESEHRTSDLPPAGRVVTYCYACGSQITPIALRDADVQAAYVEGCPSGWSEGSLPARRGALSDKSFDVIIRISDMKHPALDQLTKIVRTSRPDLRPRYRRLLTISRGQRNARAMG